MENQSESIRDILVRFQSSGLYTHAHFLAGGLQDAEGEFASDIAVCRDGARIFDLSSLTKALCTAPLVYKILKDMALDPENAMLGDLLTDWPGGLPNSFKSLQVSALLRHESGLPAWRNLWLGRLGVGLECTSMAERHNAVIEKLASLGPLQPKAFPVYSDLGFMLLGLAVEQVRRNPISVFFEQTVSSLESDRRGAVSKAQIHYADDLPTQAAVVPSAYCQIRKRLLIGEVHDENCAALGGVTGHSGLFGDAYGVASVLRSFYRSEQFRSFLEINAKHIVENTPGTKPNDSLFGFRQGSDPSASGFAGGNGMGHLGFTGTAFWVDWAKKRFAILLTNRVISGRINRAIADVRAKVFALA